MSARRGRNCSTSFPNTMNRCNGPWTIGNPHVLQLAHSHHTVLVSLNLEVLEVLVCRVTLSLWPQHVLPRHVMHHQTTPRTCFTSAAKTWWRVASKQMPVASAPSAIQNSISPIRISHCATHELEKNSRALPAPHTCLNVFRQVTRNITKVPTHTAEQVDDSVKRHLQ